MRDFKKKYETPGFVMTPEEAKKAQKQIEEMLAERRKEEAAIKAARDEKLQSLGIDASDEYFMEKLAEVKQIPDYVEQFAVKEVTKMLEKIPEVSEASAKVVQTSSLPFIIPTPVSPSNDSDLDDRMRKLSKPSPQPQQLKPKLPLQAEHSSAAAECTEDPKDPPTSDLPQCNSPSNLFSLERHFGGEIAKTPQKAVPEPIAETVVPEPVPVTDSKQTVTVIVSEQQPEQSHQPLPKQTTISTPTSTQPDTQNSSQKAIPESVVETVVSESVQATESEQTVAITVSEPIQTPTQPTSTAITNDQPSSSSSTIQTQQQPPPTC